METIITTTVVSNMAQPLRFI